MHILKYTFSILFLLLLASCQEVSLYTIQNNSSKDIYFLVSEYAYAYPDTVLPECEPSKIRLCRANDFYISTVNGSLQTHIESYPNKKMSIYFFKESDIDDVEWSVIRKENRVLRRVDATNNIIEAYGNGKIIF